MTAALTDAPAASDTVSGSDAGLDVVRSFFGRRVAEHACDDPHVVAWGSRESQESRFAILAQVGELRDASVLDVGCGVGDFHGYLAGRGMQPRDYLGIDITEGMVRAARRKHPSASFELRDLLVSPFPDRSSDFVVESGIFNLEIPDWRRVTFDVLAAMYRVCRRGVAANFLSELSGNSDPSSHYAHPSDVVRFVTDELTSRVVLRHDYRKNDFTVFLYR